MKSDVFKTELNYIKDIEYRKKAEIIINLLPDYFSFLLLQYHLVHYFL